MRLRKLFITSLVALVIAGCGASKTSTPSAAPVPSAGILPDVASPAPTGTATPVLPVATHVVSVQTAQPPITLTTPTPLATAQAVAVARTPTAMAGRAATTLSTQAPSSPPATTQPPAARTDDLPGGAPQQVIGSAHDGLVLLNVRVGKDEGFTRVVFDLAKPDGSAAPVPQARLWRDGETVVVAFEGVRDDAYARSLGGGVQAINTGSVQSLYRIPVRDDSATAYGIAVRGGGKATMSTAASPTRVIVDIADK